MDNVLLHGDIHEDQILVQSDRDLEVTGILDWETLVSEIPSSSLTSASGEKSFGVTETIFQHFERLFGVSTCTQGDFMGRRGSRFISFTAYRNSFGQ